MADVTVTVQQLNRTALNPTDNGSLSVSDVYQVPNDGKVILHFKKTSGTDCVVTVRTPGTIDGNAVAELTFTVPATTGDIMVAGLDPRIYNQFGLHYFEFTLDNIAGLTYAAVRN